MASPKPVKSAIPSAFGSPIAAAVSTPRLPEHEVVQEAASDAAIEVAGAQSSNSTMPLEAPAANHVIVTANPAVAPAPSAAADALQEAKPSHIVGLSTRAQQLMAELAAEDESFAALDFVEPVKKEKRVLIEKSNLVRRNIKNGQKPAAPLASGLKYDVAEPVAARAKPSKSLALESHVSAAAAAPTVAAAAVAAVDRDSKQVEHLKRTIDNLKAQLDAARSVEKKVVTLENQLAEQSGLIESMRKEIRRELPRVVAHVLFSCSVSGCINGRRC